MQKWAKRYWVCALLVSICWVSATGGRIIYVDDGASGKKTGYSWTDACNTLQDALRVASRGDEIRVAQGTYRPDTGGNQTKGDRKASFRPLNGVPITGGYAGLGQPDPNSHDVTLYETILSGDLAGNDLVVTDACDLLGEPSRRDNSYSVVSTGGPYLYAGSSGITITGFTITAGNASNNTSPNPDSWRMGGGMWCQGSSEPYGPPGSYRPIPITIRRCTFRSDSAWFGGALAVISCGTEVRVIDCTFAGNYAVLGGAAFADSDGSQFEHCEFYGNHAETGGAFFCDRGSGNMFSDCRLHNNTASCAGAMFFDGGSRPTLNGCLFAENQALGYIPSSPGDGGALHTYDGSEALVENCIFSRNRAANDGGAICNGWVGLGSQCRLMNSVFGGNRAQAHGGAIYNERDCHSAVINCTFCGNRASSEDTLCNESSTSSSFVTSSIIDNNGLSPSTIVSYTCIPGDWPGTGNVTIDPCFAVNGFWDANGSADVDSDDYWVDGDYHLRSRVGRWDPVGHNWVTDAVTSPCVDAGNPIVDYAGEVWPHGCRINMGAFGGTSEASLSERTECEPVDSVADSVQVEWIVSQQNPATGLVRSYRDSDGSAWIYDQSLAVIALTRAGLLSHAKAILDTMKALLENNPDQTWYECYKADYPGFAQAKDYVSGPIAWMVIGINYYEVKTGDSCYGPTARTALAWLIKQTHNNPNDERFGAVRFSKENPGIISSEHCIDAYSAFRVRGLIDGNEQYLGYAENLLNYLREEMWAPSPKSNGPYHNVNIFWRGYRDYEFCTDPQSWGVLSLGPSGPDGEEFSKALDWLWSNPYGNTRTVQDYSQSITKVHGFKSCTCDASDYVWIGLTEGVASAFYSVARNDRGDFFFSEMCRLVDKSGGLVHSFWTQKPYSNKWPENYRDGHVESVAWHYFNQVKLNPFRPEGDKKGR